MIYLQSVRELAHILGTNEARLYWLIHHRKELYKHDVIVKPNGKTREFYKPRHSLKIIQRAIDRNILTRFHVNTLVHGFIARRSIWTCAQELVGCPCLLWVDIEAFFPSISPARVREFFSSVTSPRVAVVLTELTTWENQLPQGPPTSPRLSNLTNRSLDNRLGGLARANGLKVVRYGDDIYLGGPRWIPNLQSTLKQIIIDEGYAINEEKARHGGVRFQSDPQLVLSSLIVNRKINIASDYYAEVSTSLSYVEEFGWESAISAGIITSPVSLRGKIAHIQRASKSKGRKLLRKFNTLCED